MTVEQIAQVVASIALDANDAEVAHATKDRLHQDVLREIAGTSTDERARELARAALATTDLEFPRWYA